jgi:hypothetical protein
MGWPKGGKWASLLILSMPVFQLNVWSTAVDASMGTYTVLSFLAYLTWLRTPDSKRHWFVVFAVFVGAVFAVKYTGVLIVMSYCVVLALDKFHGEAWLVLARRLILFGVIVTAMMSPWLIRNFVFTGNPMYPLLTSVFPSRNMNLEKIQSEERAVARTRPTSLGEFMTFPWKQTMLEISNFNFIGPLMLAALPWLLLVPWRRSREHMALPLMLGVYFLIALQFSGDIRYLLPGFFLLSCLLAGGVATLTARKAWLGWIVQGGFSLVVLYHLGWIVQIAQGLYNPGPVVMGQETHQKFTETMHDGLNLCPWNSMRDDLERLPDSTRVYILGNEQVYGFPKRFWYSSCHDDTPLVLMANTSANADELYKKFMDEKVTHILINAPESVRLKGYDLYPWTEKGRENFVQFAEKYMELVNVKNVDKFPQALFLYELKQNPAPSTFVFREFFKEILQL